MKDFYPRIEPYQHSLLDVGEGHQLYIEQCGNPHGQPVVFIHGGPGGGSSNNDRRFFDPKCYRIIVYDQRGCGRSVPHGRLKHNDSARLIEDLNRIRKYLGVDRWHVFGGSWGSTLALIYAQAYPQQVRSMVLRGIFLGRPEDAQWLFESGGAERLFPDYYQQFLQALPQSTHSNIITGAHRIMTGDDRDAAMAVARAWSLWEIRCATLQPDEAYIAANTDDLSCWTMARHEAHFMANHCFLDNNQILYNCHKIVHLPCTIVHGRYDIVCPFNQAWLLQRELPLSELIISETAGHASGEPETKDKLLAATNKMLSLDRL